MSWTIDDFAEVWCVDFEYHSPPGERPSPICMVAREWRSGRLVRLNERELRAWPPRFQPAPDSLYVAYYASAEIGCHLALGWPLPRFVLDLFVEFRNRTNGLPTVCGSGLLGALAHFGFSAMDVAEKEEMRDLAIRGGPWTTEEMRALLDYCQEDVDALVRLLPKMLPGIDFPRALLRGKYMAAAARVEHHGVPIERPTFDHVRDRWGDVQDRLIREVDRDYRVYEGRSFRAERWEGWLASHRIPWPRLHSGALALDDDTFRSMARSYPAVEPIRQLRYSLSKMRLADLAVGADDRNRCMLSAFRSKTGRNQPSNSRFVFGPAVWIRGFIKPGPGQALAYVDWSQQEFGIAAALSGDQRMQAAYLSGDPYLAFAKQAGAAPESATKQSHGAIRDQYKLCALGVQYGMGEQALALRTGTNAVRARSLLTAHRQAYPVFWRWSDSAVDHAMLHGRLTATYGWTVRVAPGANPRSLRNYPMQANGAEMLRLACLFAINAGVRICAPVHDALLIEAPADEIDEVVAVTQEAMARASEHVLPGFRLRSDAKVVAYPARYLDGRGERMWTTVMDAVATREELPHVA